MRHGTSLGTEQNLVEEMIGSVNRLAALLERGSAYITQSNETDFSFKASPKKWSKKEILGHIIDSGLYNLLRFTEIQFEEKPFVIRKYNQDEMVKANDYQHADTQELLNVWLSVNKRILHVIQQQNANTLKYPIIINQNETKDFAFLIHDYVEHLEHHLNQITA